MSETKSRSASKVDYSMVNFVSVCDFVPSRETRVSLNPALQEHFFSPPNQPVTAFDRPVSPLSQSVPLTVKYIELDFLTSSPSTTTTSTSSKDYSSLSGGDRRASEDDYCYTRFSDTFFSRSKSADKATKQHRPAAAKKGDHITNKHNEEEEGDYSYITLPPRSNSEGAESTTAGKKKETLLTPSFRSRLNALEATKMERPVSFAMAISENPIHFDQTESHYYINVHRKEDPSISSSPPPPPSLPPKSGVSIATRSPSPLSVRGGRDTPTESHPSRLRSTLLLEDTDSPNGIMKRSPSSTSNFDYSTNNKCSPLLRRRRSSDPSSSFHKNVQSLSSRGSDIEEELGRFSASYIGSCSIDQYIGCVDESAKKVIDPKMNTKSTDVIVQICTESIFLLPPKPGPLVKSFSVSDILCVSQCTKNKRLVGVVVWKPKSLPECHLLRSSDNLVSKALLESIQYAMQCLNDAKVNQQLPVTSSQDVSKSWQAVYVGCLCASKHQTVSDIVHKTLLESKPSQTLHVCIKLESSHIEFTDVATKNVLLIQATSSLQTLGVYGQEEGTYLGYIVGDPVKGPLTGHVLWCGTYNDTINIANTFRQICQVSYQQMIGKEYENFQPSSLFSRLKAPKGTSSPSSNSSSFQSYVSNSSSQLLDIPRKCKDQVTVPTVIPKVTDCSEEEFAKFPVTYVGTANLPAPFTYYSISQALDEFEEKGAAGGKVHSSLAKDNILDMYVSQLGINLVDRKQKMFVSRNYPRKQIIGCSQHLIDRRYFSFATMRPGFNDQLKVHVFIIEEEHTATTVEQIMKSIKFWLQINPFTSQ